MRRPTLFLMCLLGVAACPPLHAEGFAAVVSPPRFELTTKPGKTVRSVVEVTNMSASPGHYRIHTADWTLARDFTVGFQEALQSGSCRPWVAIERPDVVVPAGGTLRYRFEVTVPTDAPAGECRFALLIEGAEPAISHGTGVDVPVTGRIGVIVYLAVGDGAPDLEILEPEILTVNGKKLPSLLVHNSGTVHARLAGFLTGTDAKGIHYDFGPSDLPILPGEEADVYLTPSTATEEHPTLTFPVTVQGTLEWGKHKTELNQRFE